MIQSPSSMTISVTGLINWDASSVNAGTYVIELAVSDGLAQVTQSFDLSVIDNSGGGNNLVLFNEPLTEAFEGENYRYFTTGIADDGAEVTIALISAPTGMTITEDTASQGLYELNWVPDEANCQHDVTLQLTDSVGTTEQVTFTIDVYNAPKRLNRFQCSVDAEFCPTR